MNIQQKLTSALVGIVKERFRLDCFNRIIGLILAAGVLAANLLHPQTAEAQWRSESRMVDRSLTTIHNSGAGSMFVAEQNGNIWYSPADEDDWQRRDFGIGNEDVIFRISGEIPRLLAFTFNGQVYSSSDAGQVWLPVSNLGAGTSVLAVHEFEGSIWLATSRGLLRSSSGVIWADQSTGLPSESVVTALEDVESVLYAASGDRGVFRRDPATGIWSAFNAGLSNRRLLSLAATADAVQDGPAQELFAGSDGGGAFGVQSTSQFWRARSAGMGAEEQVLELTPFETSVAALTISGEVFVWEPYATSWNLVSNGLPANLEPRTIEARGTRLYVAGSGLGLYSRDLQDVVLDVNSQKLITTSWNVSAKIQTGRLMLNFDQPITSSRLELALYNLRGQLVWQRLFRQQTGSATISAELPDSIDKGVYLLHVNLGDQRLISLSLLNN